MMPHVHMMVNYKSVKGQEKTATGINEIHGEETAQYAFDDDELSEESFEAFMLNSATAHVEKRKSEAAFENALKKSRAEYEAAEAQERAIEAEMEEKEEQVRQKVRSERVGGAKRSGTQKYISIIKQFSIL